MFAFCNKIDLQIVPLKQIITIHLLKTVRVSHFIWRRLFKISRAILVQFCKLWIFLVCPLKSIFDSFIPRKLFTFTQHIIMSKSPKWIFFENLNVFIWCFLQYSIFNIKRNSGTLLPLWFCNRHFYYCFIRQNQVLNQKVSNDLFPFKWYKTNLSS